jgi:hypothetical protein
MRELAIGLEHDGLRASMRSWQSTHLASLMGRDYGEAVGRRNGEPPGGRLRGSSRRAAKKSPDFEP